MKHVGFFRIIYLIILLPSSLSLVDLGEEEDDDLQRIDLNPSEQHELFDPHDLLNYDRKEMIKLTKGKPKAARVDPFDLIRFSKKLVGNARKPLEENQMVKHETANIGIETHTDQVESIPSLSCDSTEIFGSSFSSLQEYCDCENPTVLHEKPILWRYIRTLYSTMKLENIQLTENDVLHIPLTAKITARTHSLLQEIVLADNSIQEKKLADLDEILLNLLELNHQPNTGERSHSQIPFGSTIFHPKNWISVLFTLYLGIICLLLYRKYMFCHIFGMSLVLVIVVSCYTRWHEMYQKALSKSQSDILKYSQLPASCNPSELGYFEYFSLKVSTLFSDDPCDKYHEILMTDPVYQISLVEVVSDTLFHPLGVLGGRIGQFYNQLYSNSSWVSLFIAVPSVTLLLVLILFFSFGYVVDIGKWGAFGSIKPAQDLQISSPVEAVKERTPKLSTATSLVSSEHLPTTPPTPSITVILNMVTDSLGDSKVQKLTEFSTEPSVRTIARITDDGTDTFVEGVSAHHAEPRVVNAIEANVIDANVLNADIIDASVDDTTHQHQNSIEKECLVTEVSHKFNVTDNCDTEGLIS